MGLTMWQVAHQRSASRLPLAASAAHALAGAARVINESSAAVSRVMGDSQMVDVVPIIHGRAARVPFDFPLEKTYRPVAARTKGSSSVAGWGSSVARKRWAHCDRSLRASAAKFV